MHFNTYEEALNWIHGTLRLGIKPGLKRMELLLEKLDHPEKKNRFIHIAGTNGKGSTLTFLSSVLQKEGYRVGTFTSPYIETFNERISINSIPISDADIVRLANQIAPITEEIATTEYGPPSEFEIITAMMFLYFAEFEAIDFGIIEVGLGGRLDSTNVLTPILSIITTIGLDHMEFLGNTIEEIAFEKGGIIKPGIPVVTGVLQDSVIATLAELATSRCSPFYLYKKDFASEKIENELVNYRDTFGELKALQLGLAGDHQIQNASVAIYALRFLHEEKWIHLSEEGLREGLADAFWPGRLEKVTENPTIILDGAHNPEGIRALIQTLQQVNSEKVNLLFSALLDKKYDEMIQEIQANVKNVEIYLTTFDFPRAMAKKDVLEVAERYNLSPVLNWKEFLEQVPQKRAENPLYITGSLYFISEVRKHLLGKTSTV
ncbi:bifunctional folylpolyglutamate synthase/dihydrofolate synthase [Listeria valentina]|uniref:bifunctional folylpolyglutamate synthase/dihydrofolate synthase n=1 Tax=Listeria valentina TaxID=2705293 RepID=UPI00142F88A4|nr:folylpolyglutamate synthase/dihydrofolate synthase family protein [Listeria valentina]